MARRSVPVPYPWTIRSDRSVRARRVVEEAFDAPDGFLGVVADDVDLGQAAAGRGARSTLTRTRDGDAARAAAGVSTRRSFSFARIRLPRTSTSA